MKSLKVDGKHFHLFTIAIRVFAFGLVLFILNKVGTFIFLSPVAVNMRTENTKDVFNTLNTVGFLSYAYVYFMLIYSIYFRLNILSKFVDELGSDERKSDNEVSKALRTVSIIVDKFCDLLETIKLCYTISTVIFIFHFLLFSILSVFGIINYIFQPNSTSLDLSYSLLTLVWEIYYTPFMVSIIALAFLIKRKGEKIRQSIQKMLFGNRRSLLINERANLISLQLFHRGPSIEVGVFAIDFKLVFTMLGLCFSYLVIIIQFEFNL